MSCKHPSLFLSSVNLKGEYKPPSQETLRDALRTSDRVRPKKDCKLGVVGLSDSTGSANLALPAASTFPALMVLPGDELEHDPNDASQSVQDWIDGEHRNEVTRQRGTIYVAGPPAVHPDVALVREWAVPNLTSGKSASASPPRKRDLNLPKHTAYEEIRAIDDTKQRIVTAPTLSDIVTYLEAFYHGLPVKPLLMPELQLAPWEQKKTMRQTPYIGLSTGNEVVRIRTRSAPDNLFPAQLNLDDLLEGAISILPTDAYALLMLVNHDIYEDEEDDFCCGRAYGGSRVAIVSTARYHPDPDRYQGMLELEHAWPASHCRDYLAGIVGVRALPTTQRRAPHRLDTSKHQLQSPMEAAIAAFNETNRPGTPEERSILWLARVAKTAAHELGHCFGIGHCAYYSCVMQGSSSLAEDARQPPYLCPIDLRKLLVATGADEDGRDKALVQVCERFKGNSMFPALTAWIKVKMERNAVAAIE